MGNLTHGYTRAFHRLCKGTHLLGRNLLFFGMHAIAQTHVVNKDFTPG
jgi:hypothetical protein